MKKTSLFLLLASSCLLVRTPGAFAADKPLPDDFPRDVPFQLGEAEFAPGDSITIQAVRGHVPVLKIGKTYCVTGTYTLSSQPEADLALFLTTTNHVSTPVDPGQTVHVQKGSGNFTLIQKIDQPGYPHVSFYPPAPGGSSFGGVYFGQGRWVLNRKGITQHDSSHGAKNSPAQSGSLPAQNRRLLEYLGSPVAPPDQLDPAYTKAGLTSAMRLAARKAGISLQRLEIEDSEFPFLVGIVCAEEDYPKMLEQIKEMPAYEEQGGVSSKTCRAINVIPWRAFPSEASQRIGRRMTVREGMFFDQLIRHE